VTLIGLSTPGAVAPSAACTTDAARATGTPLHDAYAKQQSASEKSALCGTLIAVVIGLLFSWIVVRTNTPYKGFIAAASILPLFAPPLVAGVAWAILESPKTGLINTMFKWIGLDWRVDLQGCELMTARSIFPVVRPAP
jgi:ABC-type Fe3+ transport system permease subunit